MKAPKGKSEENLIGHRQVQLCQNLKAWSRSRTIWEV